MRRKGADISPGDFAENITVEGIDLSVVSVGQKLHIADAVELEVTQLGKRCHGRCKIFEKVGDCFAPLAMTYRGWVAASRPKALATAPSRPKKTIAKLRLTMPPVEIRGQSAWPY